MVHKPSSGIRAFARPIWRSYAGRSGHGQIPRLRDATLNAFRAHAFEPALPYLLPKDSFQDLPALSKWFIPGPITELNVEYLSRFATVNVPLEITSGGEFAHLYQPLRILLESSRTIHKTKTSVYLAQASLSDLPQEMRDDVPTPELVIRAGKGDIYDSSIWIGKAPTYTPLHRDPNPNLFVQLAGAKRVRMFDPSIGNAIFTHVQRQIGGAANASIRGEEMMQGREREALEAAVWDSGNGQPWMSQALDCEVAAGDALFIPKGWWHSLKGVGAGMTGSVNWWFR